jgi:hypothetical protein
VESPEHALLECQTNPDVLKLRTVLLGKLLPAVPKMQKMMVELDSIALLKAMIYERSMIVLMGKFVHNVLKIFYTTPVYRRRDN